MTLTLIYHQMWKGSKEAAIQAMMSQAKVEEMPAFLQFGASVQELATIPEWPAESTPPTLGLTEGEEIINASGNILG
eukprot:1185871-Karenia_brevis.AAC.1